MEAITDFLTYPFLTKALIGSFILAIITGLISPFIIVKRQAFLGSAISHSTLLGLAIGIWLFGTSGQGLFVTTLICTMTLSFFLAISEKNNRLTSDSLIGLFFTFTMGLGILIHGLTKKTNIDLMSYLFGNILLIENTDLWILFLSLIFVLVFFAFKFKSFVYSIFDPIGANLSGVKTGLNHLAFIFLLTFIIVSGLKIAGTILVNTLLIVPGFFALRLGRNVRNVFLYSVSFSVITTLIGLVISNSYNLPIGATLSTLQCLALFAIVLPRRA